MFEGRIAIISKRRSVTFHILLQVLVPKQPHLLGKQVEVKIVSTKKHCLIGEIKTWTATLLNIISEYLV